MHSPSVRRRPGRAGRRSGITTVHTYGVHYTLTGLGTDAGSVEFLFRRPRHQITRYRSSELEANHRPPG